jgi:hypothetical protein
LAGSEPRERGHRLDPPTLSGQSLENAMLRHSRRTLFIAALLLFPAQAFAGESLVGPGGKPGVATEWSSAGGNVTISVKNGFNPAAVAAAIQKGVAGSTAKVDGGKVVVSGVAQAKLLSALEKISVEPGMDDVDSNFAAIQNMGGGEEEGSGSSIRASKTTDFSEVMKESALIATVKQVQQGSFPVAFLVLKVVEVPAGAPEAIKKGATITVVPRIRTLEGGSIDPKDSQSTLNVGAWFARPGDKVAIRLGSAVKDKKDTWLATSYERR